MDGSDNSGYSDVGWVLLGVIPIYCLLLNGSFIWPYCVPADSTCLCDWSNYSWQLRLNDIHLINWIRSSSNNINYSSPAAIDESGYIYEHWLDPMGTQLDSIFIPIQNYFWNVTKDIMVRIGHQLWPGNVQVPKWRSIVREINEHQIYYEWNSILERIKHDTNDCN